MKGQIDSEIIGIWNAPTQMTHPLTGKEWMNVGVYVDQNDHISEPIYIPENQSMDEIVGRIDSCDGPTQTIWGKLLRNEGLVYCPALVGDKLDSKEASRRLVILMRQSLRKEESLSLDNISASNRFRAVNPVKKF
jgi:hypothetical protein